MWKDILEPAILSTIKTAAIHGSAISTATIIDLCDAVAALTFEIKDERFLDELQAAIVLAGGNKIPTNRLKTWTIAELMNHVTPNGVKLHVTLQVQDDLK